MLKLIFFRLTFDPPISVFIPPENNAFNSPFVLRQQPHILLQGRNPLRPLADSSLIQASMYFIYFLT